MRTFFNKTRTPVRNVASRIVMAFTCVVVSAATANADIVFSDDFTSSTLNPAWQVLPGQGSYTTGSGDLRYFNDGPTASTTGWYNPALTLALPFMGTSWEIDTKVTYNLNWCLSGTYTGPSNPDAGCSSGAQGPELLVKFDPAVTTSSYGGPDYAGADYASIERSVDAYYGSNDLVASYGSVSSANLLDPADANINNNIAGGTYWYKIIREGGTLTVDYSSDGSTYATAFSTSLSDPTSTYNELLLGGITYLSAGSYADYAFVNVTAPVPEPGSIISLASAVAALALARFRRKTAMACGRANPRAEIQRGGSC